ncbi:MAG: lysostaphin resistance A-like protein [Lachnospiraceae bacterium]
MDIKKQFSRIGWAYVLFLLMTVVAQIVVGLILRYKTGWYYNLEVQMLASQFAMYGCGFPVFYALMRRIPSWRMSQPKEISVGNFVLCVAFCFGFSYIGGIIGQILMVLVNEATNSMITNPVDDMISELSPWVLVLTTVVIAPVMEEVMFRKILIDRIIPFGQKAAVIVSGISFGLFHGNFYQFFYACILGMIFAYIYSHTGKIRYTIILHMIINFVGGLIPVLLNVESEMLFWMGGCMITAIVLSCVYARRITFFPGWENGSGSGIVKRIMTAPGVIGFLVLCIIMFVWN